MIPRLPHTATIEPLYAEFLSDLERAGFRGEIRRDYAARMVAATDNSIYQFTPQAVIFPRSSEDVVTLCRLTGKEQYRGVCMTPRGGGTGTTGGALSSGLSVDLSKHMHRILAFDAAAGTVRVEPGVVLDQLNRFLRPHGFFFAPHVATADRATLGGMIGNDSCGVGSRLYGRTSEHVESLRVVLSDGSSWHTAPLPAEGNLDAELPPRIAAARAAAVRATREHAALLRERLPQHSRFLSGYDLVHARCPDGRVDLARLISGSEGTLAFVVEATLRVTSIPPHRAMLVAAYDSFDAALDAAGRLLEFEPAAIETIDDRILALVRSDEIWPKISALLSTPAIEGAAALNMIELCDERADRLTARSRKLLAAAAADAIAARWVENDAEAQALWAMRARGVGLLGNMPGPRRPLPFVEDCAVPPERLPAFVKAMRAAFDEHRLAYGMYGHADVGCIHVRPALDLTDPADAQTLRRVSDRVFHLVNEFGGVFWGEHGKGVRSEYATEVYGPEIYTDLRRIKAAFDPFNQMNPGKIAAPDNSGATLLSIGESTRGDADRGITAKARHTYDGAVACNGNGACFSWDVDRAMCPSMRVTRDRVHSPKGRAALMREWLRLLSERGWDGEPVIPAPAIAWFDPRPRIRRFLSRQDFSHEVHAAFNGCLACKACVAQCPIHVDIPRFKTEFLDLYHRRYPRRLRDHLVAGMESGLPRIGGRRWSASWPFNAAIRAFAPAISLVDPPVLASKSAEAMLRDNGAEFLPWDAEPTGVDRGSSLLIVLDPFTNFFAPQIATAFHRLARSAGASVCALPYRASGKSHHVLGFLHEFNTIAARNAADLSRLRRAGFDLVCIEPAIALFYRQEYRQIEAAPDPGISLPQEWITDRVPPARPTVRHRLYRLLSHCTEATTAAGANQLWGRVFAAAGLELEIPQLGCCGMAGRYGHEVEHAANSRAIFEQSWRQHLAGVEPGQILATGHSCRTQVARVAGFTPRHPIEILAATS